MTNSTDAVREVASLDWTGGLLPCVVQDVRSGAVLMLAWMNREAFERTRQTGEAWFWSRSRQTLWRKGETSGHTQRVTGIRVDCDGDAIMLEVVPTGPACHTGQVTCFYRAVDGNGVSQGPVLAKLEATIHDRARRRPDGSYTASLLSGGVGAVGAKIVEETEEVVQAARSESDQRLAEEAADLLYHFMVLLETRGVGLAPVLDVLAARAR